VTRTANISDIATVRRLLRRSVRFDLEGRIVRGWSPLREALVAGVSAVGLGLGRERGWLDGTVVYVERSEPGRPAGLLAARLRRAGQEADITALAPDPDRVSGGALTWQRLLSDGVQDMATWGVLRVHVKVPETEVLTLQILRQSGFQPYVADTVLRAPASGGAALGLGPGRKAAPGHGATLGTSTGTGSGGIAAVTEATPVHAHSIGRILAAGRPASVRTHEDPAGDWEGEPLGGRFPPSARTRVALDKRGEVIGAWRTIPGRGGSWSRFALPPDGDPVGIVARACAEARSAAPDLPLFCAALGHEIGLHMALREAGFEPVTRRFRLVRHTAARRVTPAWSDLPAAVPAPPPPPVARSAPARTQRPTERTESRERWPTIRRTDRDRPSDRRASAPHQQGTARAQSGR